MSLHAITLAVAAKLREQGCPYPVLDREPSATTTWGRPRIVIEEDADRFDAPRRLSVNPKVHYTAIEGAKVSIYAKSAKVGAKEFEHRTVAKAVRDQVLVALRYAVVATLNQNPTITGGRFFVPEDLAPSEVQGGAAYELTFTYEQAVAEITWAGEPAPEGGIDRVTSTTNVRAFDADGNPITPTTACGA